MMTSGNSPVHLVCENGPTVKNITFHKDSSDVDLSALTPAECNALKEKLLQSDNDDVVGEFLKNHEISKLKDVGVDEIRKIIPKLFLEVDNHDSKASKKVKGLWDKTPPWWDCEVPFFDPNNKSRRGSEKKKATKPELLKVLTYLVKQCRAKRGYSDECVELQSLTPPSAQNFESVENESCLTSDMEHSGSISLDEYLPPNPPNGEACAVSVMVDVLTNVFRMRELVEKLHESSYTSLFRRALDVLQSRQKFVSCKSDCLSADYFAWWTESVYVLKTTTEICRAGYSLPQALSSRLEQLLASEPTNAAHLATTPAVELASSGDTTPKQYPSTFLDHVVMDVMDMDFTEPFWNDPVWPLLNTVSAADKQPDTVMCTDVTDTGEVTGSSSWQFGQYNHSQTTSDNASYDFPQFNNVTALQCVPHGTQHTMVLQNRELASAFPNERKTTSSDPTNSVTHGVNVSDEKQVRMHDPNSAGLPSTGIGAELPSQYTFSNIFSSTYRTLCPSQLNTRTAIGGKPSVSSTERQNPLVSVLNSAQRSTQTSLSKGNL